MARLWLAKHRCLRSILTNSSETTLRCALSWMCRKIFVHVPFITRGFHAVRCPISRWRSARKILTNIDDARKIFYGNVLFHRSLITWKFRGVLLSLFLLPLFIMDQGCYTFLHIAVSREKKTDTAWRSLDEGGQRGGGSFRRAEMLNYPIACERM